LARAAALLDEQAFKQIRGSDRPAVCLRGSQVRNASFEVVHEAGNSTFLLLNAWQVGEGLALAYTEYPRNYVGQQKAAQDAGRGMCERCVLCAVIAAPMQQTNPHLWRSPLIRERHSRSPPLGLRRV
jgi:hypothetical protein